MPKYVEIPFGEPTVPPFKARCNVTFDGVDYTTEATESRKIYSQHEAAQLMLDKLEEVKAKNPAPVERFAVTLAAGMKVKVKQNVENYAGQTATLEKFLQAKDKWGMILSNNKRIALHKDSFAAIGAATMYKVGLPVELLLVSSNTWVKGNVAAVKGEKVSIKYVENGQTRTNTFAPDDSRIRRAAVTKKKWGTALGPLDIDVLPKTFLDNEFKPILTTQLKNFGTQNMSVDNDFINYVNMMIRNKRSQTQFINDLTAFFGAERAEAFGKWLWSYLGEVIRRVKRAGGSGDTTSVTKDANLRFVDGKVGVDFRYGRNGWRITAISQEPSQPSLRVNDVVTHVAGQSLLNQSEDQQIAIFKNNLRDNVPLNITRRETLGTMNSKINYANNQLGVDFEYSPVGWRITNIANVPGQPGLKLGDLIIAIAGNSITNRGEDQQAQIFKANLKNGVEVTLKRAGVATTVLPTLPPINYGTPKEAISAIGAGTLRIRVINNQIGIGFKYHAEGWQVVHIETRPGQPGLKVGDIVTKIGVSSIQGLNKNQQMEIFANNIKNGCQIAVKRTGVTLTPEQAIIDFYPTIQADTGADAPPPCKIDQALKGKLISFSLKGEKFFAKITSIRNVQDYPYQLQYIHSSHGSEWVNIDPDSMRIRDQNRHVLPFTYTDSAEAAAESQISQRKSVFEREIGGGGGGRKPRPLTSSGLPAWWGSENNGRQTFEAVYGRRPGGGGGFGGRRGRSASPGRPKARGGRRGGGSRITAGMSWSRSRSRSPKRKMRTRRRKQRFQVSSSEDDSSMDEFDDVAARPKARRRKPKLNKFNPRKQRFQAADMDASDSDDDEYEDY